ncbi:MAG: pyridoxal-dependent decarboxylase [Crocinitomicaceae bacterium]|nr:pyridoxal-dependent decarboxylase [Crocinitomicaceae bacterium]
MTWIKKEQEEIKSTVFTALQKNKNFAQETLLGIPASYLDSKVFSQDDSILKDAPFLTTLVLNPNHIGCHTLESSESFFAGTHAIERDVISICSEDILKADAGSCDGYVASGGTEANIQAIWIYRNYYLEQFNAKHSEIAIICSDHSHYSMAKGANLLNIGIEKVETNGTLEVTTEAVEAAIERAEEKGVKYFIVVVNMMTTMFGSVDDYRCYTTPMEAKKLPFKMHVDAAFGGFYYPFSNIDNELNFANEYITSVTLDAHKMAQAPYGTGLFLIRKDYMHYATTKEASYVEGEDSTLIGSRSGANAVSIWMILSKYGPNGWMEKIFILQKRTDWLCEELDKLSIDYYRNPYSNIVTLKSDKIPNELAVKYGLVPDNHHNPSWYKIVVMEHVLIEKMEPLIQELKSILEVKAIS